MQWALGCAVSALGCAVSALGCAVSALGCAVSGHQEGDGREAEGKGEGDASYQLFFTLAALFTLFLRTLAGIFCLLAPTFRFWLFPLRPPTGSMEKIHVPREPVGSLLPPRGSEGPPSCPLRPPRK